MQETTTEVKTINAVYLKFMRNDPSPLYDFLPVFIRANLIRGFEPSVSFAFRVERGTIVYAQGTGSNLGSDNPFSSPTQGWVVKESVQEVMDALERANHTSQTFVTVRQQDKATYPNHPTPEEMEDAHIRAHKEVDRQEQEMKARRKATGVNCSDSSLDTDQVRLS